LQDALFYKFRDQIIGVVPIDDFYADHSSVLNDKVCPVPPKTPITPKRKIYLAVKTKKAKVVHGRTLKPSSGPKGHPSWTEVVRKGEWSVRFAEPKQLKQ
jgi:hypothetical protein